MYYVDIKWQKDSISFPENCELNIMNKLKVLARMPRLIYYETLNKVYKSKIIQFLSCYKANVTFNKSFLLLQTLRAPEKLKIAKSKDGNLVNE